MTLSNYVDVLIQQCEYVEFMHSSILIFDPKIYRDDAPCVSCTSTGTTCHPGCNFFDPAVSCKYSDLTLDYQTFVQAFWQYRSEALRRQSKWSLFYGCFHPKPSKDAKEKFKAIFPQDVPLLGNQDATSNYEVGRHLDPADPGYWSRARLSAATSGQELDRRMAATDWDWDWFSHTKEKGITPTMYLCREKNKLDKLLFDELGDDYENTGSYTFEKTHRDFLQLQTLYKILKDTLLLKMTFTD